MKIKLSDLATGIHPLRMLCNYEFTGKTLYSLTRILVAANREYELFEKAKMSLLTTLGTPGQTNELGQTHYSFTDEHAQKYQQGYYELQNLEITLWGDKLALADIDEKIGVKPAVIAAIPWLFKDFEEEAKAAGA
jgi:hypothetical protein